MDASHKTVVVIDHSPALLAASNHALEFDIFSKSRSTGIIPLAPLTKSMWTCNVEAIIEYCRIIYDIFPAGKLIRLVASDTHAVPLNNWSPQQQNLTWLMTALARVGPPSLDTHVEDCNVMHGLSTAIEMLCEPTDLQIAHDQPINRGSIICITTLKSDAHVRLLEECVQDALTELNKLAASTESLLPLHHCDLVLVNVTPVSVPASVMAKPHKEVSPVLTSEVRLSESGKHVTNRLTEIAMAFYKLASTTIIGIPMKEEQNASSSANYDVELLHCKEAHTDLIKGNLEGLVIRSKEDLHTDSITLKWCTPKSTVVEMQPCAGAYRITPVDVNSRPSSCLTNFLLNGRAVMLEQPRKQGTRVVSHMLASHGGEIFIHTLVTGRTILEDPPSISEGCGGRVTDYRINDFGEFMKENRLAPLPKDVVTAQSPIDRARCRLERLSKFWPMVLSESIIVNMLSHLDPLPSIVVKEQLTEDDVLECRKVVYHVVDMETNNEAIPIPPIGSRGKGPKRDEQYRQLWNELEQLVGEYTKDSPEHQSVLECIQRCRRPDDHRSPGSKKVVKEEKMEVSEAEAAWNELTKYQKLTEREKQDLNTDSSQEIASPDSPPPMKKARPLAQPPIIRASGPQSLLSMWTNRIKAIHSKRHDEFSGRLESTGNHAQLYKHLNEDNKKEFGDTSGKK